MKGKAGQMLGVEQSLDAQAEAGVPTVAVSLYCPQ